MLPGRARHCGKPSSVRGKREVAEEAPYPDLPGMLVASTHWNTSAGPGTREVGG